MEKTLAVEARGETRVEDVDCGVVKNEYHAFLGATVKFVYEIQERQEVWRWGAESAIYDGVAWLQGLWASRDNVCFLPSSLPF